MSEEEINKMCSDIYEGEDWQPMKDYIKSLQTKLQQKENIIKEVREYITNYINQFNGVYPIADMRYLDLHKLLHILKGSDKK